MIINDTAQESAIRHGAGPCAVIAGPGSGKTHVLTMHIRHLTGQLRVPPSSILVLTFSRAAAWEIRFRYLKGGGASEVTFGTFHAVFYRILQESSHEKLRLISPAEKRSYLFHLCGLRPRFPVPSRSFLNIYRSDKVPAGAPPAAPFRKENTRNNLQVRSSPTLSERVSPPHSRGRVISSAADPFRLPKKATPEKLQLLISRFKNGLPCGEPWIPGLVRDYDRFLEGRGCLDFDDMVLSCRSLLINHPDVLERWRQRFQWILVDEFQDVSRAQYDVLRLLAGPRKNLFVVGDDDQSIYGFRGAYPGMMRQFLADHGLRLPGKSTPGLSPSGEDPPVSGSGASAAGDHSTGDVIFLSANYRCGRSILSAGTAVIRENRDRIEKNLRPGQKEKGTFYLRPFSDKFSQYSFIARELRSMDPEAAGKSAVIFRTHFQAASFLRVMMSEGIPFVAEGTQNRLREKPTAEALILRDLIAYFRCAAESSGSLGIEVKELLHIMNKPERFLSGSFADSAESPSFSDFEGSGNRIDPGSPAGFGRHDVSGAAVSPKKLTPCQLAERAGYERAAIHEWMEDLKLMSLLTPALSFRYLLDSVGYRAFAEKAYKERKSESKECGRNKEERESESKECGRNKEERKSESKECRRNNNEKTASWRNPAPSRYSEIRGLLLNNHAEKPGTQKSASLTETGRPESGETAELSSFFDMLSKEAEACRNSSQWLSRLEEMLNGLSQWREASDFYSEPHAPGGQRSSHKPGAVRVITMHACKGLEFDSVFIPDLNEGNIPSKNAWTAEEIEEERRLLYVAMTRARRSLTITFLEGSPDRPAAPSRFLRPLL